MKKLFLLMLATALVCSFSAFMSGCSPRDDESSSQTAESKLDDSSSELIVDEQPVEDEEDERLVEAEAPSEADENSAPPPVKENNVNNGAITEGAPLNDGTKPEPELLSEPPSANGKASQAGEAIQIELYAEQKQYPLDAESVRVFISNKGSENVGYDAYYSLEQLQGENWQEVTAETEVIIEDWAGILSPGKETSETIDLKPYAGKLEAGHYRIAKKLDDHVFYAPFELE